MSSFREISQLIFANEIDHAKEKIAKLDDEAMGFIFESMICSIQGDFDKQAELCQRVLEIENVHPLPKIMALEGISWSYIRKGNYSFALDFALLAKEIFQSQSEIILSLYPETEATLYNTLASINIETGKLLEAESYYRRALEVYENVGSEDGIARIKNNLAFSLQKQGKLNEALKIYEEALEFHESLNSPKAAGRVKSNIAEIYRFVTNFPKALKYHKEVLDVRETLESNYDKALSNYYVGLTYYEMGFREEAVPYLLKSRELWEQIGNTQWLSATLLALGKTYYDLGSEITEIIDTLKEYAEVTKNNLILQRYLLILSIVNKSHNRMASIAEAQIHIKRLLKMEMIDFELTYDASLMYCELLFFELKITNDESIYDEIKLQINQLDTLAKFNNAYGKQIEIFFLKAKLAIIENHYDIADAMIMQAEILADEQKLPHLKDIIISFKTEIESDINKIQNIISQNKSLFRRLEIIELEDYLTKAYSIKKDLDPSFDDTSGD